MNIAVVGIGGTGCKIVDIVKNDNTILNPNINFIYIDNNKNSLENYDHNSSILLNCNEDINEQNFDDAHIVNNAIRESLELIKNNFSNIDVLILCSGFGGKTGTLALPFIAKISKEMGILTIAVVTSPFSYEGIVKEVNALAGLNKLKENIDVLIPISNNRILNNYPDIAANDIFKLINKLLKNTLIYFINLFSDNLDFKVSWSEVLDCLRNKKESYIGFGSGIGKNKIIRAVNQVTNSKIIDTEFYDSKNIVMTIIADPSFTAKQIEEVEKEIRKKIRTDQPNILLSLKTDEKLVNEIRISLISTFNTIIRKESFNNNQDLLQKSQEILLKIGNTLENEMNGYITNEIDLSNENDSIENNNLDDNLIVSEGNKDEDDIPFFLK